ncbi:hypothetical protein CS022_22115 [Veronia nyctiphanis]|uniref:START domain-containing protein n=1 Tax=Veronia nyctiphanis TaxID=1278244 RepID=A0A4Q0YNF7_9GAMM|nr:hypothetical protein [Veronia nyctiphanis]RXJ70829.1 hypothetical protein CS022_22115 [Veronia nyctiphanis]
MKVGSLAKAFLLSALMFVMPAHAEKLKGTDGVEYTSRLKVVSETLDGDVYATVTGRILLDGTLGAPISIVLNTDRLLEWVHDLNYSEVLKVDAANDQSLYMIYNAPLTLDDRDVYVRFLGAREGDNVFTMSMIELEGYEANPKAVRMTDLRGVFRIEQITEDKMGLKFTLHYNPDAKPVFAANSNTKQLVKKTMKKFKKLVEGEYKGADIPPELAKALNF